MKSQHTEPPHKENNHEITRNHTKSEQNHYKITTDHTIPSIQTTNEIAQNDSNLHQITTKSGRSQ